MPYTPYQTFLWLQGLLRVLQAIPPMHTVRSRSLSKHVLWDFPVTLDMNVTLSVVQFQLTKSTNSSTEGRGGCCVRDGLLIA